MRLQEVFSRYSEFFDHFALRAVKSRVYKDEHQILKVKKRKFIKIKNFSHGIPSILIILWGDISEIHQKTHGTPSFLIILGI